MFTNCFNLFNLSQIIKFFLYRIEWNSHLTTKSKNEIFIKNKLFLKFLHSPERVNFSSSLFSLFFLSSFLDSGNEINLELRLLIEYPILTVDRISVGSIKSRKIKFKLTFDFSLKSLLTFKSFF